MFFINFFWKGSLTSLLLRQRQLQAEIEVWSEHDKDRDGEETRRDAGKIQAKRRVGFVCVFVCVCTCIVCCFLQLEASLEQLGESLEAVKLDRAAIKKDLLRYTL